MKGRLNRLGVFNLAVTGGRASLFCIFNFRYNDFNEIPEKLWGKWDDSQNLVTRLFCYKF